MKRFALILCSLFLLLGISGMANAALIQNGSFENPELGAIGPGGGWAIILEADMPSWSSSVGSFEVQEEPLNGWVAAEGDQWIELDGYDPYIITQGISTTAGQQYILEFAFTPRPNVATNILNIGISDSAYGDELFAKTISESGLGLQTTDWEYFSYTFTANSQTTFISFGEGGPDDQLGSFLDDISVNSVPEPATMLLLGTGLIGLAGFSKKKFRKK